MGKCTSACNIFLLHIVCIRKRKARVMMKKGLCILMIISMTMLVAACSNESKNRESIADRADSGTEEFTTEKSNKARSEEHTSELQSRFDLVCRLLLEKKKETKQATH